MSERIAPDIYFPIEIVSREYAGHLLLAVEMTARGRSAVLGHKSAVQRAMALASRPGLLFYKNARMPSWAPPRRPALAGLDPETGIVYDDFRDFFARRPVVAAESPSRAQFCFGPDDYDFLVTHFPDHAARIHLTGAPRVTLWGDEGKRFYREDAARIRDHYGDVILFASSGGFTHEQRLRRRGQDPDETWAANKPAHHFFQRILAAAKATERSLVVRPHPSDSWNAWHRATLDLPNVSVDTTFDLAAWTRAAIAIVHPGTSTAAFEAVCAGVPAIATGSKPESNAATRLSYRTSTLEEFVLLLAAAERGELPPLPGPEAHVVLERKLLQPLKGSAERIADVLDETVPVEGPSAHPRQPLESLSWSRSAVIRTRASRDSSLGERLGRSDAPPFKRSVIRPERVERDVDSALEILGRNSALQVRPLGANCFVLSS